MSDLASYAALFTSAFLSATLLPGSSEALLIAMLVAKEGDPATLIAVATAGNVLGSCVNWVLGRFFAHFSDRRWFPVGARAYERAAVWYQRFGIWSLLFAWLPVVGDPLTLAAGAMRTGFVRFLILVTVGKLARYLFLASAVTWWTNA
jgi:membrane protein YqaA with SNARE-associated domain